MEKSDVIETTYKILEELKKDDLVVKSHELEKELLNDPKLLHFIIAFNKAQDDYNDALKHNLENKNEYLKKLSEAKEKLYKQEKVKDYFNQVNKTQEYLDKLTSSLFDGLIDGFSAKKRIK